MKTNKLQFLFIFGDIPWPLLFPQPEECECSAIDPIFRFLTNEIGRKDLPPELQGLSLDDLQKEYNRLFSIMTELKILS